MAATARILAEVTKIVSETNEPLRFTAALADGHDLFAFRYSANDKANTLYYRASGEGAVIVSEPLDLDRDRWKAVPPGHVVVARAGHSIEVAPFLAEI